MLNKQKYPTHLFTHLTNLLTKGLTLRSGVLFQNLTDPQPVKKLPAFYRTRRFITVFTSLPPVPILSQINPSPRSCEMFRNMVISYGYELLPPRLTSKVGDHPLSLVRSCLVSIFAVTLHTCRPFPPSASSGRAMLWWQGPNYHRFD